MESQPSPGRATPDPAARISSLHRELLAAWNRRDAEAFAALFADGANSIGFDGSQMNGREEIAATLAQILADHQTASYVGVYQFAKSTKGPRPRSRAAVRSAGRE
jgi:uncharacterized protein (TIGR02246 family)